MMTCRKVVTLVTAHLEGALDSWEEMRFRFHLLVCPSCRIHVSKMEQLIDAMPETRAHQPVPDDVIENLPKLDR